jgi:hypothetical protein
VSNIQPADATVTNGTLIDISADVENAGNQQGTQDITLSVGGVTQTQTETLNASENTTVTFQNVDTGALGPGSYTHEIASANDSTSGSLTVQAPANFTVTIDSTNSPVTEGETLVVNTTIENTGGQQDTQSVSVDVGALGFASAQTVTLNPGDSTTENYTLATSSGDAGDYTATLSSDNDTDTAGVTVETQTSYGITNVSLVPDTVDADTQVDHTLNYTVTGASDDGNEDTHTVTLPVGANFTALNDLTIVDANGDPIAVSSSPVIQNENGGINNSVTIGIQPDASANTAEVGVEANVTVDFPAVESDTTEDVSINVTDSNRGPASATTPVTIIAPEAPANFTVTIDATNSPVTEGDALDVTATIENTGDVQGTQTVDLTVGALGTNSTQVTLAGGANTTETFTLGTTSGDNGTYTATVSSANDSASTSVTVDTPLQQSLDFADQNLSDGQAGAVLVGNVTTDGVSSAVLVTYASGGDDVVAGIAAPPVSDGDINVSIDDAGGFPGPHTAHIIPADDASQAYQPGDVISAATAANITDSEIATVSQAPEPGPANFTVSNIQPADATVTNGAEIDISADVENIGGQQGTQDITLTIDGVSQTQTETLNASANTTVTFQNVDTGALGPGSYTHTIASANASASGQLTVEPEPTEPTFLLSNLQPADATVTSGAVLDISADVENVGDQQGTQTLQLTVDGLSQSKSATLAGGANTTVTFQDVDTSVVGPGSYTHEIASANDSVQGSLTVEAPAESALSGLDIAGQGTDATLTAGDQSDISANVTNVGDQAGSFNVTLTIADQLNDIVVDETQQVNVAGGATETVVFENVTDALAPDEYDVSVSTPDDEVTGNLTVEQPPTPELTNLSIADQGTDATITNGSDRNVSVDVTNVGDQQGAFTVTVDLTDSNDQSAVQESTSVSLGAGETTSVVFENVTGELAPDDYNVTISSDGAVAEGTLSVIEQPTDATFLLSNLQPTDALVANGSQIDISADVENVGDLQGTQDITLSVDGVSQTQTETLAAGANTTVTFQNVDTGALGIGEYTHEIATANDTISSNLTVSEPIFVESYQVSSVRLRLDQTLTVNATVRNIDSQSLTLSVPLTVDGQTVDTVEAQVDADSTATVTLQADDLAFGNASVAVAGLASTNVTVEGPDLTGNNRPAADTTGDGRLNDVNGNGEFNALDVQALFSALDDNDPALQPNSELFNFQGSFNEVTILDVQGLFNQLPSVDS